MIIPKAPALAMLCVTYAGTAMADVPAHSPQLEWEVQWHEYLRKQQDAEAQRITMLEEQEENQAKRIIRLEEQIATLQQDEAERTTKLEEQITALQKKLDRLRIWSWRLW